MTDFRIHGLAVSLALMLASTCSQASMTLGTDSSAFDSAVTAIGVDTFFGVPQDSLSPSPLVRRTFGTQYTYVAQTSAAGLVGAGSADQVWLTSNLATDTITFTGFSASITAFGGYFFGTDFNGQYQLGDVVVTVTDADGNSLQQTIAGATTSSFLGFISDGAAIISVSLYSQPLASGDSPWPTTGQLMLAQSTSAVPEPSSAMLLALGAGLVWLRRRSPK